MKKILSMLLLSMMLFATACGEGAKEPENPGGTGEEPLKAILIVNGNLGDLGFFDSANQGMERLKKELGVETKVIETGADESKWEPALADAAEEDVDIIIAVSPSMVEPMEKIAPDYPDKRFFLIDNSVDYTKADLKNVYSATFKQNEGSFLAGVLAAKIATSDMENISDKKLIGFIGGMDIPPINDFLVGYIEGAQYVDKDVKVIATYPGDYYDPAKGKEHGIVQINNGANVIFPAAGPTGLGSIEAAKENGKYIIGVDSDQALGYLANGDEETANIIISSMTKNVGDTIFRAVEKHLDGTLSYGASESLGIAEGGVGLAKNDIYNSKLSDDIKKSIEDIQKKVLDGEIKISTAIGMSSDDLAKLKSSVAP